MQLLADVYRYFADRTAESYPTEHLLRYLTAIGDAPWATFAKGKAMTPRHLARLLQPYGIKSKNLWQAGAVAKGYEVADFVDAFARYLPSIRYAARSASSGSRSPDCVSAMNSKPSGYETASPAREQAVPSGIADKKPETPDGRPDDAQTPPPKSYPQAPPAAPPPPPVDNFSRSRYECSADATAAWDILKLVPDGETVANLAEHLNWEPIRVSLACIELQRAGRVTITGNLVKRR